MIMKMPLVTLLIIAGTGIFCHTVTNEPMPCPPCIHFALGIIMLDSAGTRQIAGFSIKATNDKGDTAFTNDTTYRMIFPVDSVYAIEGSAGIYRIEITGKNYAPILLQNINVEQGVCGVKTRVITIVPERTGLAKRAVQQYRIVRDTVTGGCGN
jgi:hypothetical protein